MSTLDSILNTVVSNPNLPELDNLLGDSIIEPTGSSEQLESWAEPGYSGSIDYRIRQLSYSSLLTLHSCPRKFQLDKLRSSARAEEQLKSTITFSFGHVVGEGIALVMMDMPWQDIVFKLFCAWHTPSIFDIEEKTNKSFWDAILAVQKFVALRPVILKDYEIVYFNGKPAAELSFCINFPDGFRFRGFVDVVLKHRVSGEILVLECKTTASKAINPSTYRNSAQAIGYSIVLDHIFPSLSSYRVLYLVYSSSQREYIPISFDKNFLQRALWIRSLLLDIETIKMYDEAQIYPQRGESCVSYNQDCYYINSCMLSTEHITRPCTAEQEDKTEYQINVSLLDLLESQLTKTSTEEPV